MFTKVILSVVLLLFIPENINGGLPSYLKTCHRNDQLHECILENIENVRPHLKNGIPKLYLPPLNPFVITKLELVNDNLQVAVEDYKVYHMDDFKVEDFDVDLDENKITFDIMFPFLDFQGKYNVKGKILLMEINGSGDVEGNGTQIIGHGELHGKRIMKDEKEYIGFVETKVKLEFNGETHFYFHNLFGNNEELTQTTNKVLNENVKTALEEVKGMMEEAVSGLLQNVVGKVFEKYPLDELLPM